MELLNNKGLKVALILLCGLPASGKTYLTREISSNLHKYKSSYPIINELVIGQLSYDDYIPKMVIENDEWKLARKNIQKAVEIYFENVLGLACENLPELNVESLPVLKDLPNEIGENKSYLMILDDNFYYTSMRHEWYQVARKYGLGFGQVFLKCDVNLAISRNSQRTELCKVMEEEILRMSDRAEWPNPAHDKKHCHSVILNSEETSEEKLFSVINLIRTILNDPVQPLEDNSEEKELSKIAITKNLIHQSDIILRKLVSQTLKDKGKYPDNLEVKDVALKIANVRHSILSKIKCNELNFQDLVAEDEINLNVLNERLEKVFQTQFDYEMKNINKRNS